MAAIDELGDEAVLIDLVHNDPEPGVRAKALSRVTDSAVLDKLCETLTPPLQSQARSQRLDQLLPDRSQLSAIKDDATLVRIASLSDDPDLLSSAIGRLQDQQTRVELASTHPVAKIRLSAAHGIDDVEVLKEVMHLTRNKDKSVFRYCKERVDQHHAAEQEAAERAHRVQVLAEDAAKLASAAESQEFRPRYLLLRDRWQQLQAHAGTELAQQIQADLDSSARRLDEWARAREEEQKQQQQVKEAREGFVEILAELEGAESAAAIVIDRDAIQEFAKWLDRCEERWVAAMQLAHPSAAQTQSCKNLLNGWRDLAQSSLRVLDRQKALEDLLDKAKGMDRSDFMSLQKLLGQTGKQLTKLSWPESHAAIMPALIVRLRELQESLQEQIEHLKAQEKQNLEKVEEAFSDLRKELDDNHFKNADRVHNRLRNLLRHLSPSHQDHFHQELRPLTARLGEIHDWQSFTIEPKKIELCEQMAALIGSPEEPDVLANRIKALQKEWKALGPIAPRRDQALWKKFHAAAEEAYAPCKLAFEQQAALRKQNLKQRMELVAQLVDYDQRMAWPGSTEAAPEAAAPDWKLVQKTLDTARAAFNAIGPVSAKGERKSRKALQVICDKIYGHIKDEYGRNIEIKKALVAQAQECVEMEDLKEAINRAKGLQRDWNQVGLTPRQVDRRLWKEFRSACDGVFGRLDDERKQHDAARNERAQAAKERAEQAKARALKEQQRWPNLLEKMQACAMKTEDEKKAAGLWQKEEDIPKGIDTATLEAWWEQGPDDALTDDQLRQACIALEVLAGVESPPEDKEARMAYQMQRLVEGMGTLHTGREDQLLELVNGFVAMRPKGAWVERFCGVVEALHAH